MSGIERIAKERMRQIHQEGWSDDHDDEHSTGSLAQAALCYIQYRNTSFHGPSAVPEWPWDDVYWKPKDYLRNLERAGALIAAELDRIERNLARQSGQEVPNASDSIQTMIAERDYYRDQLSAATRDVPLIRKDLEQAFTTLKEISKSPSPEGQKAMKAIRLIRQRDQE